MSRPRCTSTCATGRAFRRLADPRIFGRALGEARAAAAEDGTLAQRLDRILAVKLGVTQRLCRDSVYASELLGESARVSADLDRQFTADMTGLLTETITGAAAEADLALSDANAREIAELSLALTRGLETDLSEPDRPRERCATASRHGRRSRRRRRPISRKTGRGGTVESVPGSGPAAARAGPQAAAGRSTPIRGGTSVANRPASHYAAVRQDHRAGLAGGSARRRLILAGWCRPAFVTVACDTPGGCGRAAPGPPRHTLASIWRSAVNLRWRRRRRCSPHPVVRTRSGHNPPRSWCCSCWPGE
jgi:hypothetical protein